MIKKYIVILFTFFTFCSCSLNQSDITSWYKIDNTISHFWIDEKGLYYQSIDANIKNYYPNYLPDEVTIITPNFFVYKNNLYSDNLILERLHDNSINLVYEWVDEKKLNILWVKYLYDKNNVYTTFFSGSVIPNFLNIDDWILDLEDNMLMKNETMYCFWDNWYSEIDLNSIPIVKQKNNIRILTNQAFKDVFYLFVWCKRFSLQNISSYWNIFPLEVHKDFDINSIELIGKDYLKIGEEIYTDSNALIGLRLLPYVDKETFQHITWYYYKDKDYIYYKTHILYDLDPNTAQVVSENIISDGKISYFKMWQIKNSSSPVEKLSRMYFKNGNDIYSIILDSDPKININPESFEILWNELIKDDEKVYFWNTLLPLNPQSTHLLYWGYYWDNNRIYFWWKEVKDIDIWTFEVYRDTKDMAHDKNHIYFRENKLNSVDVGTFEVLNYYFWKDKDSLYYLWWWQIKKIDTLNQDTDIQTLSSFSISVNNEIYKVEEWNVILKNDDYIFWEEIN